MKYQARAPLRFDLGGGWTTGAEFAREEGGLALAAAINRYVRGSISRRVESEPLSALRSEKSYFSSTTELGEASGLGVVAAQTLLWVTLVKSSIENVADRRTLANMAWSVDGSLGIVGGGHEEHASALGGITFTAVTETVDSERIDLGPAIVDTLRSRLLLIRVRPTMPSLALRREIDRRVAEGNRPIRDALRGMKKIASDMKAALEAGEVNALGQLLRDHHRLDRDLGPLGPDDRASELVEAAERGGAGGAARGSNGVVLALAAEGREDELRRAISQAHLALIDWDFDTYGVFLTKG